MLKPNLPVWRSLLYVPVNAERFVEKAHTRGADCVQLDLEDSVPPHHHNHVNSPTTEFELPHAYVAEPVKEKLSVPQHTG